MNAPIVLFVYNRYDHTRKTVEALMRNQLANRSKLYVFVDYVNNEAEREKLSEMYNYLNSLEDQHKFESVEIRHADRHRGLANSVISGVTEIVNRYEKVIVLEDDIVTCPIFLQYMNACLNYFENDKDIWSISGYAIPEEHLMKMNNMLYLSCRADSWGWATWKDRWDTIDWSIPDYPQFKWNLIKRMKFNKGGGDMAFMLDRQRRGEVDSWAIRWCYNQYQQGKFTVYPTQSYVENIGFDGSGTNYTSASIKSKADIATELPEFYELHTDRRVLWYYNQYNSGKFIGRIKRILICLLYNLKLFKIKK